MKINWVNNNADVGRLELRVRQATNGKWSGSAFLLHLRVFNQDGFDTDAAARAWCERMTESIVDPIAEAIRVEECKACAKIAKDMADGAREDGEWEAERQSLAIEAEILARSHRPRDLFSGGGGRAEESSKRSAE